MRGAFCYCGVGVIFWIRNELGCEMGEILKVLGRVFTDFSGFLN